MGYFKAPEQPQSSARPIYHSPAMTRTGREPATHHTHCCIGARHAAAPCASSWKHMTSITFFMQKGTFLG